MTLEELIDSALADGKLSRIEKKILLKKAKDEGYDLDEVEIYLNARLHEVKRERWNRIPSDTKGFFKMIIGFLLLLIPLIIWGNWDSIVMTTKNRITSISCGCDNVDDCLAKYKFEEARKFVNNIEYDENDEDVNSKKGRKISELYKIFCSESYYWISQNEFKRAEISLNELRNLDVSNYYDDISENAKDEKYLDLVFNIISKYCQKQQFENAEMLTKELPINQMNDDSKYKYPRKEALKIISEFRKDK